MLKIGLINFVDNKSYLLPIKSNVSSAYVIHNIITYQFTIIIYLYILYIL